MDILETAINTAEAIGMELTHTESVCYDVLKGYNYDELVSLCDKKGLDKFIKGRLKQVNADKPQDLFHKVIVIKSEAFLVLGKVDGNTLIVTDFIKELYVDQPFKLVDGEVRNTIDHWLKLREKALANLSFAIDLFPKLPKTSFLKDGEVWAFHSIKLHTSQLRNSHELDWGFRPYTVLYKKCADTDVTWQLRWNYLATVVRDGEIIGL